jgi:cyanate permease
VVLAGGAIAAAATIMPWITASLGGQTGSLLGTELDQLNAPPVLGQATGYVVIVLGVILAALGLAGLLFARVRLAIGAIALVVAVATGVVIATAVPAILDMISSMTEASSDVSVSFGYGFILAAVGAALAVIGSIAAVIATRR